MGTHLDLDDAAGPHPVAVRELAALRAEIATITADRDSWVRRADKTWHEKFAVEKERERCIEIVDRELASNGQAQAIALAIRGA